MERHFHEELDALKARVAEACAKAEDMVETAVRALVERNAALVDRLDDEENRLNASQVEIDDACCKLIALHQPAARDLRFLLGLTKINREIERLGDKAISLGGLVRLLLKAGSPAAFSGLPEMLDRAASMMRRGIRAFLDLDANIARDVIAEDPELDALKRAAIAEVIAMVQDEREAVENGVRLIFFAKGLERIGDLACNIAEDVVFIAEGLDLRHREDVRP